MTTLCDARYADSTHLCEKPLGHRSDSTNVYSDPDGAHRCGGLWWTEKWCYPAGRTANR